MKNLKAASHKQLVIQYAIEVRANPDWAVIANAYFAEIVTRLQERDQYKAQWENCVSDINAAQSEMKSLRRQLTHKVSKIRRLENPKTPLCDTDAMPFGKYKGTLMEDVPASYLFWLWTHADVKDSRVSEYIRQNLDCLKEEYPDGEW
jgi:uncharacterized protein (DUF3820 family)